MYLLNYLKSHLFSVAVLVSVFLCAILFAIKLFFAFSYLPDISGSEMSTIFPVQFLADDKEIYSDPEHAPFRFTQYTPIYLLITSWVFELTGWVPGDVHKVFVVSRLVSMFFTILASAVVGLVLIKSAGRKMAVGVMASCIVFQVLGFWILTSSRPDSLMVLLTALFVATMFKAVTDTKQESTWYFLAIFLAVTAFFTKQSGTIHSIALGVFLIYHRNWKLLFKVVTAGLVFFGLYLAILPLNTVGFFFDNIVGGVENSVSWGWFYDWTLERFLLQFAPLLVLNFSISFYTLANRKSSLYDFLAICSGLFFAFSTVTAFKVGAGVGYYQDYLIVSVIQIALFVTEKEYKKWFSPVIFKGLCVTYLVIVCMHCTLFVYMSYSNQSRELYTSQYIKEREVAAYITQERGLREGEWVYVSESDNFTGYFLRHFLFKNVLIPFPDIIYLADKNGLFDFSGFRKLVDDKHVRFVVVKKGVTPSNILNYDFGALRKVKAVHDYDIYEHEEPLITGTN